MADRSGKDGAIVVGAGPNGLAAAIVLAQAGVPVTVLEGSPTPGGGCRTEELTLPGYVHDVCSAIHPLALASPLFKKLPLEQHGLRWIYPDAQLAHPLEDGSAITLERSVEATALQLGPDRRAYERMMGPIVKHADIIGDFLLGPLRFPRHPLTLARFGLSAIRSVTGLGKGRFRTQRARGLFAGLAAHSMLDLDRTMTVGVAQVLGLYGHGVGWPMAAGGAQRIIDALVSHLRELGGEVVTDSPVRLFDELPPARAVLFDVTPRQLLAIAGTNLPAGYKRALGRFRYGPGVFKIDLALDEPIPWKAPECARAGTVHLGGTMDQIAAAERAVSQGKIPERPFVLLAQHTLFDPARAPNGKHTVWAYCHVPHGSDVDMTNAIESQIERFAPGFRDRILARHTIGPRALEAYNPNYIGGDINGGAQDLTQHFTRPVARLVPYATPAKNIYICSSSTPPGGGVHGMCGYWAARAALRRSF